MISNALVEQAAGAFLGAKPVSYEPLGTGLIHFSWKVPSLAPAQGLLLQAINTQIFPQPAHILENYLQVYQYLQGNGGARIPAPIASKAGPWIFVDPENIHWRATRLIEGAFSPTLASKAGDAAQVAQVFGEFTRSLLGLDPHRLHIILEGFHDLGARQSQLEEALAQASGERRARAKKAIEDSLARIHLVHFFEKIRHDPDFKDRIMHHDCKISNILFHQTSGSVICPVDLDTLMPGKFFSDLGDMIRSMAASRDENSTALNELEVVPEFYRSLVGAYREAMGNAWTEAERASMHYCGLLLVYMQAIRFLADYLRGDTYYQTGYPGQNLDRATNQLTLLSHLEKFLKLEYHFTA